MKKILSLSAFLAIALFISTACQMASTANIAGNNTNKVQPSKDAPHTDDAPRISLADAKKDFDAGNAIFVDTRAEAAYKSEHIKGSINISSENFETKYKELPTGKKIIAYCSWPAEHTSAGLVTKLQEKGIENAFALIGGTKAWKEAGFPMEKGEEK